MPPMEIIDLLSSPTAPPPPPFRKSPPVSTKVHTSTSPKRSINNVCVRSSPRRRAARAAVEREERAKMMPKRRLEDVFMSDEMDPLESSPALPALGNIGDAFGRRVAATRASNDNNTRVHGEEAKDPFASSPSLPTLRRDGHWARSDFMDASNDVEIHGQSRSPKATEGRKFDKPQVVDLSGDLEISGMDEMAKGIKSAAQGNPDMRTVAKGDAGYYFLSDDFDSSINIDTSYSIGATATKKRRLSMDMSNSNSEKKIRAPLPEPSTSVETASTRAFKKSASDVSSLSTTRSRLGALQRARTSILVEDPIMFTSSPDAAPVARNQPKKLKAINYDDPFASDDFLTPALRNELSPKPDDVFIDLDAQTSEDDLPDIGAIASQRASLSRTNSTQTFDNYKAAKTLSRSASITAFENHKTSKPTDQKSREKAKKAADRLTARKAEKERKQMAKEEKAREKQAAAEVAKVNTLKTDKKTSTPEMIVDLPTGMDKKLVNQITTFFAPLGVQMGEWEAIGVVRDVVRWRRKVVAKYNEDLGYWEPVPKHIVPEGHVLCIMQAKEFVELSMADEGHDLDAHMLRMKSKFKDCTIMYLIEGLTAWQRKNKNIKNRQFADAVRCQMDTTHVEDGPQVRRRKTKVQEYVDADMIEDSLLRLQVVQGALIHHTGSLVETAQWVVAFTQHISTIPYRRQKMAMDTAFCMETGQVKTGENAEDTFVKMLQEITRITPSIAYGIAAEYPTVQKLVKGFKDNGPGAKDMLANLKKSTNKDGAFSDRDIGKRISRRVWDIFTGTEQHSTDV